jgi:mxaJ protein
MTRTGVRALLLAALAWLPAAAAGTDGLAAPSAPRVLRVCADPDNLPFSGRAGDGLENRLVALVAARLLARL